MNRFPSRVYKSPTDQNLIEYDRRIASRHDRETPAEGYIPNATTAIAVASAVAIQVFEKELVDFERSLRAGLKDNEWTGVVPQIETNS
jgi:hypothetical protein